MTLKQDTNSSQKCGCDENSCLGIRFLRSGHSCMANEGLATGKVYVLVCKDRTSLGPHLVFWRPNSAGYTTDLKQAGLYDLAESNEICSRGDHVRMVASLLKESTALRVVIDRDLSDYHELSEIQNERTQA